MKKLSLVMAAAMCLTVGGVYATWNYASSNEALTSELTGGLRLEGYTTLTDSGTITVKPAGGLSSLVLLIDQNGVVNPDTYNEGEYYKAVLTMNTDVVITYTPKENNAVQYENGIQVQWKLSYGNVDLTFDDLGTDIQDDGTLNVEEQDKKVFNTFNTQDSFTIYPTNTDEATKWQLDTSTGKNIFTYTITKEKLAELIVLNNFKLETLTEWTSLNTKMTETTGSKTFTIDVAEVISTTASN